MKQKEGITWAKKFKRIGAGVAVSMVMMLLVIAVGAGLVSSEVLQENGTDYIIVAAILLGSMVGTGVCLAGVGEGRIVLALMHGLGCFLALLCLGILLFDGISTGIGTTALLILGGSGATALAKFERKGRFRPAKRRYAKC